MSLEVSSSQTSYALVMSSGWAASFSKVGLSTSNSLVCLALLLMFVHIRFDTYFWLPLERGKATYSSILVWRIPRTV